MASSAVFGSTSVTLATEIRKYGFHAGFYPISTILNSISLEDPTPSLENPGIYRVSCGDFPVTYVGKTGPKLKPRLTEHRKMITSNGDKNTAVIVATRRQTGHDINKITGGLLDPCVKDKLMDRIEKTVTVKRRLK